MGGQDPTASNKSRAPETVRIMAFVKMASVCVRWDILETIVRWQCAWALMIPLIASTTVLEEGCVCRAVAFVPLDLMRPIALSLACAPMHVRAEECAPMATALVQLVTMVKTAPK